VDRLGPISSVVLGCRFAVVGVKADGLFTARSMTLFSRGASKIDPLTPIVAGAEQIRSAEISL
jgi:hypothetical protein